MNLDTQNLLRRYRIDVEYINLEDTFELENMFYKRQKWTLSSIKIFRESFFNHIYIIQYISFFYMFQVFKFVN